MEEAEITAAHLFSQNSKRSSMSSPPSAITDDPIKRQSHRLGIDPKWILGVLADDFTVFTFPTVLVVLTASPSGFAKSPATKSDILASVGMEWDILWQSGSTFITTLFALCRNWVVDEAVYHISRADVGENSSTAQSNRLERTCRSENASLLGRPSNKHSFSKTTQGARPFALWRITKPTSKRKTTLKG